MELKIQRLTSTDYLDLLRRLQPKGVLWRALVGSRFDLWLQASAVELARVHNRLLDVLEAEMFPSTASETLAEWLRNLGLPDATYAIPATEAEQQALALSRWLASGGGTAAYFIQVALDMGFTITITETPYPPFRCGVGRCGDALGSAASQFYWRVNASAALTAAQRAQLEAEFARLKPAHTIVEYVYS